MLRELNLDEMEMVSGGQSAAEDVVVGRGIRHTADDGGAAGPPVAFGASGSTGLYSPLTGQTYRNSDERALAEAQLRQLREQFGNPKKEPRSPTPETGLNNNSGFEGTDTGIHLGGGFGVDPNTGNPGETRLTYTTDF